MSKTERDDGDLASAKRWLRSQAPAFAERVAPLYRQLDWQWANEDVPGMPSRSQITRMLRELIADLGGGLDDEHEECVVASGGLEVRAFRAGSGCVAAAMSFTVDVETCDAAGDV